MTLNRNAKQTQILTRNPKVNVDPILAGREVDKRYSVCIVSRPTDSIRMYIKSIQDKLHMIPGVWLTPPDQLHTTVMEIVHSKPPAEIESIVHALKTVFPKICDMACEVSLVHNPLVNFDANAIALSFTSTCSSHIEQRVRVYDFLTSHGIDVQPRYVGPSLHITIARFTEELPEYQVLKLLQLIKELNQSLEDIEWKVGNLELCSGAIWYGQHGKMYQ
ncbi:hypothetical protein FOA43_004818 [Brettanomyces nanus]|uniref:Uncharacterized protein n=1 Tax=Eeniella nana TaxID=13502 RepID=A0A875SFR4_EENNA|nr:uncharacterized protein FOA43_004818 [Brettanomyces nanus]QPG77404.1 hypothetical protein FOA43_004818 [Brettanomyces nanus]